MAVQENSAVVRELYESFKAGDIDAMLGGMAEDIEWQLQEIAGVPFSGKRRGHDSIREVFASVAEMQDVLEIETDTVTAQGDTVVVLGHYSWRVKATGRSFSSDFAHAFHMAHGKVGRFQEFLDTAAAAAAGGQEGRRVSRTDSRNIPPAHGIKVPMSALRKLVASIFKNVPVPDEHAELIAALLIDTELRGVVSHGVEQVKRYVRSYQEGKTNPRPRVRTIKEGPTTAAFSGDGGLGMIVATRAMRTAIAKARQMGAAATTATYHAHLGSTGKYVRMALSENMIGIAFSGRSAEPEYGRSRTIHGSIQGSPPLAFGMPSGCDHPPFLLDMASRMLWDEDLFRRMPQIYLKAIGISHVANIMSGTLGGQMLPQFDRRKIKYSDADQSGFFMALDITRFVPLESFRDDMDHLMAEVSRLTPMPSFRSADLPGGPEWKREKAYRKDGISIGEKTKRMLEELAGEFRLSVPWG